MRKVLSFVLVLAMILGSFSMVFAAEFKDVESAANYHDAVAVLSDLEVVSGYTDGTFKPEKVVTRAEMAALIVKALGIAPAASATTNFPDVPNTHWASGYIAYANSLGILKGYTDGTFKPEKTVSYDEAITMLIQALGYTIDALTGAYPAAFVSKAKALGILDKVSALGTVGANRGDISIMLYNTLRSPIGHVDKDGAWTAAAPADNMMVRLGAVPSPAQIITAADASDAVIDISNLIGAYVTPYVNKAGEIVAIYEVLSEFQTAKLDIGAKTFGSYKLAGFELGLTSGTEFKHFVNGENVGNKNLAAFNALPKAEYTIAGVFSGNYVKKVYSVSEWSGALTKQITANQLSKIAKGELFGKKFVLDDRDEIVTGAFQLLGVESLDKIVKGNIVSVYFNSKNEITKLEVGTEIVSGKVASKSSGGKLTIGDKGYYVGDAALVINVGDEGDFFLGYDGDIYAVDLKDTTLATNYGIIIKTAISSGLDDSEQVRIFTAEGKKADFTIRKTADIKDGLNAGWGTAGYAFNGRLVSYKVNSDGLIVELTMASATPKAATKLGVTKAGILDGHYFADGAVIFADTTYTGLLPFQANGVGGLSVVKASALYGKTLNAPVHYILNSAGKITLMLFDGTGATTGMDVFAVYQGEFVDHGSNKYTADFMVDGEVKNYGFGDNALVAAAAKELVKINPDADGEFTALAVMPANHIVALTTAGSLSGKTFKAGNGATYALNDKVHVYTFSGNKAVDAELDVLTEASATLQAYFYDVDGDTAIDFVLIK